MLLEEGSSLPQMPSNALSGLFDDAQCASVLDSKTPLHELLGVVSAWQWSK
jgi:hypothetical protein